jgi:hypothetical protein
MYDEHAFFGMTLSSWDSWGDGAEMTSPFFLMLEDSVDLLLKVGAAYAGCFWFTLAGIFLKNSFEFCFV